MKDMNSGNNGTNGNNSNTVEFETTDNNLDALGYIGSMHRVLANHIGEPIIADFLVGTNNMISKSGILYDLGEKYIVIHNAGTDSYMVGDIYNLKFATFAQNVLPTSRNRY